MDDAYLGADERQPVGKSPGLQTPPRLPYSSVFKINSIASQVPSTQHRFWNQFRLQYTCLNSKNKIILIGCKHQPTFLVPSRVLNNALKNRGKQLPFWTCSVNRERKAILLATHQWDHTHFL